MIYIIIICIVIIGVLSFQLYRKKEIEKKELAIYKAQLDKLIDEIDQETKTIEKHRQELTDLIVQCGVEKEELKYLESKQNAINDALKKAREEYTELTSKKMLEIDESIAKRREARENELEQEFNTQKEALDLKLQNCSDIVGQNIALMQQNERECYKNTQELIEQWNGQVNEARQRYESLLEPIKQYEKDRQEKLFYTIQLPDEFKDDIEFLLTTVAAKVQHPDIISKLVWAEYVKPNLDDTFKRIEIKPEPGIYKLTSLNTGKAYIGKSTDVKKRISDHFKSAIGIRNIADQAIHHAILKEGFWNWTIEVITYCDKDKLNELEKYYIEFFKTQEFGYNKNSGGGG